MDKHNEDDTRESTEVYKFLKKTFPTNDYKNYTREEALRLKAHKKAQMTPQERLEMEQNKRFVEQLGQLQYFPPKTEKKYDKNGVFMYELEEPGYYRGRVHKYNQWVDKKEHFNEIWAGQNFNAKFLAFVHANKGKWIDIPPGDATDDKAPKFLRSKVRNEHRQYSNNTCMISSFACALAYIAKKEHHGYIDEAAKYMAKRAIEF